jgi:hypothetical protein
VVPAHSVLVAQSTCAVDILVPALPAVAAFMFLVEILIMQAEA